MRFASDENFDGRILRGLIARMPELDILRVQDTIMYQKPDTELLAWLADENRILLTHDINTMPGFVYERVRQGLLVPGVIIVQEYAPIGPTIEDLQILMGASAPIEFENQVRFVPIT